MAAHADDPHRPVLSDRVIRGAAASLSLGFSGEGRLVRRVEGPRRRRASAQDRRMARPTVGVWDGEPHVRGLRVEAREEPKRIEAREQPDLDAPRGTGAAMTRDAADLCLPLMMESRKVRGGGGNQAAELLVVKMARDAKAVVSLLRREPGEEQGPAEEGAGDGAPTSHQPAERRAPDCRPLPLLLSG